MNFAQCTGVTRHIQYNLPGCSNTVMAGQQCGTLGSAMGTCCPIGFDCMPSAQTPGNLTCAESKLPTYAYAPSSCTLRVPNGLQCGKLSSGLFAVPPCCMQILRTAHAYACTAAPAPAGGCTTGGCIIAPWSYACCADGFVCVAGSGVPTCQADPYPYVPPALQRPNLTLALPQLAPLPAANPAASAAAAMLGIGTAYPSMTQVSTRLVAANAAPALLPYLGALDAGDPFTRDLVAGVLPNLGLTAGPSLPTSAYNLLDEAVALVHARMPPPFASLCGG